MTEQETKARKNWTVLLLQCRNYDVSVAIPEKKKHKRVGETAFNEILYVKHTYSQSFSSHYFPVITHPNTLRNILDIKIGISFTLLSLTG